MSTNEDQPQPDGKSDADAALEREIRSERKFTLTEAIGRLAGPGSMKGASPIARPQQVTIEIETWLRQHLADSQGALQTVLLQRIAQSDLLLKTQDEPLQVLAAYCQRVLDSKDNLSVLVRHADVEWGRAFEEKPRFDQQGEPPHPDDPYTMESVRSTLNGLLEKLKTM